MAAITSSPIAAGLFMAQAIVTAPVIYTTAAGTGGPLLWNPPTCEVNAVILGVSFGITVVTTVAAALGLTGNSGQTVAPCSTTAIDGRANLKIGGAAGACTPYRVGTVAVAGAFLLPFGHVHTGALTVDTTGVAFVDIGGALIVPPGAWCSIAASATASTTVGTFGMVYEEVPVMTFARRKDDARSVAVAEKIVARLEAQVGGSAPRARSHHTGDAAVGVCGGAG